MANTDTSQAPAPRGRTVLVFTAGDYTTASSKYRAFLLGKYLTQENPHIAWEIVEPSTKHISELSYFRQVFAAFAQAKRLFWFPQHDVVYIQRAIYNKFIFTLLIIQNILRIRPSIFDFDDAIFIHSGFKTRLFIKTSSATVVGSHHLETYAKRYAKRAILIPTCVRYADYAYIDRSRQESGDVTIGWLGDGPAYLPELHFLAQVLRDLNARTQNFRLLLIGARARPEITQLFDFIPEERREIVDYVDATTDADLVPYFSKMDIGVMPLQANEWNKGKCAFKAVQYMASGAAVLASPVGENSFLIDDLKTGILASTKGEWVASLLELIENASLRQSFSAAAREHIRQRYSFESQIPTLVTLLDPFPRS
ncbi:hypothetical protein A2635_05640 [Candidatus Peribacteria bacterium RIFCSPHIGHO2_01_FULL_51_9]|nr:MAG: hypothetical protein A2635_05640 [Candidatus Peribacteria bacterium RIFCSPHIGHO2_01_FULL_51_9]